MLNDVGRALSLKNCWNIYLIGRERLLIKMLRNLWGISEPYVVEGLRDLNAEVIPFTEKNLSMSRSGILREFFMSCIFSESLQPGRANCSAIIND